MQHPVELILIRQLASYLATPMFVVDAAATLLYYNEAAEELLGGRFDDTSEMHRDQWMAAFKPHDFDGTPLGDENPLLSALSDRREHHRTLAIVGLDGAERSIAATAFPLLGPGGRLLGAVAVFWPEDEPATTLGRSG